MAKTDCVFLLFNFAVFDLLVKVRMTTLKYVQEKLKKERDMVGQFIYPKIPRLKEQFSLQKVIKNAHLIFKPTEVSIRGHNMNQVFIAKKDIIKEGGKCDKLYIIREGQCAIYKIMELKDKLGVPVKKQEKLLDIEVGEIFGEDYLCFGREN